MHTCSTSTSPPSSDQQVWWRDRLDLQHDGVVYMVENFCSRASPTNSREGERKGSRATRVWRQGVGGRGRTSPLYIEGGGQPLPLLQALGRRPREGEVGGKDSPPSRNPISSLNEFKLSRIGWALWGLVPLDQSGQDTPSYAHSPSRKVGPRWSPSGRF